MKARYVVLGAVLAGGIWATAVFAVNQVRIRDFESGPTPTIQLLTDVSIGVPSDNGKFFCGSVGRKTKGYALPQACIWSPDGQIKKLATDGLFTSSVDWVSDDGKKAVGMIELNDVPIDDPKKPSSYLCEWSAAGPPKKTPEPDWGTIISVDGTWIAYNTFYPPEKYSDDEYGDSKTIELRSLATGKIETITNLRGAKVDCLSNGGQVAAGSIDVVNKSKDVDPVVAKFGNLAAEHHTKAAVWVDGKMTQLTDLDSWAVACSPDGKWVVGIVNPQGDNGQRGFRWSRATGFEILPGLSHRNFRYDGITSARRSFLMPTIESQEERM